MWCVRERERERERECVANLCRLSLMLEKNDEKDEEENQEEGRDGGGWRNGEVILFFGG